MARIRGSTVGIVGGSIAGCATAVALGRLRASSRDEISIQPIYDHRVDSYAADRVALVGDAGAVCRPHTASGTAKAFQDALCLERLGREHAAWAALLAAYDAERSAAGAALVELGRRIGATR